MVEIVLFFVRPRYMLGLVFVFIDMSYWYWPISLALSILPS
jgi:hypothetical protein